MFALLIACTYPKENSPPLHLFHLDDGVLLNQQDQQVLLRGFNARVHGIFDVYFDDGREELATIPTFTGADCQFFSEQMGLNVLRLPINWSGIEPEDDQYDERYIRSWVIL